MHEEYTPLPIRDFKGLYVRGKGDTTPPDHFQECQNVIFTENGVASRDGIRPSIITGKQVQRIHLYKRVNEATRMLILFIDGVLVDSVNVTVPILTIPTMLDFSAVNMFNRVYISPHNGKKGLPNEKVYVWDGTTMRAAGGTQPVGTLIVMNSDVSGNIEAGTHLFAVVFETASGFYSKPGPALFARLDVPEPGDRKADVHGIPIGPAGTIARHIIATRAILNYDGNQYGQEFFFISDGVLNDNTTTDMYVNFYDSQLVEDANYLFDVLNEIPAGLVLGAYKGRMVVANFDNNQSLMRVSPRNEPEVFNDTDSAVIVDPEEPGGITNVVEHRDLMGITKSLKSYITSDNGGEPNTWDVIMMDKGVGTEVHGISSILDSTGASSDRFFVASRGGLIYYDGSFHVPELSYKIEDLWRRINPAMFHKVEVEFDTINKLIYVLVPFDKATDTDVIFVGDVNEGLDYKKIRWSAWSFSHFSPSSIIIDIKDNNPVFKIGGDAIYEMSDTALNDNGWAMNPMIKFGLAPPQSNGIINHFNFLSMRISGSGSVNVELSAEDNARIMNPPNFILEDKPGIEIARKINFVAEKMAIKFSMVNIDNRFELNNLVIYHNPLWSQRPA
jgi:hypothetical protein